MEEVLQQRDNKHSKGNQMFIETVSVEQTMGNTMKLKWKGEMRWGNGFEMSEVWSRRSPSGCGDAIWPTEGRVQPPGRGGVVGWLFWFRVGRHDIGRLNTLNGRAGREYPPGNFTLSSCEVTWWILSSNSSVECIWSSYIVPADP